jgi:AmpD protein
MRVHKSPLPHFNDRPAGAAVDTIVIHSMYAPGAHSPCEAAACAAHLDALKLSAHYFIAQDGAITRLVEEDKRAWHAGLSKMPHDGRENVNDFSIGIELLADLEKGFPERQYHALAELTADLCKRFRIRAIFGHEHIAPDRKKDPGPRFDWARYRKALADLGVAADGIAWPSVNA